MTILIKLFLNTEQIDLIRTVKFLKQLFRIQIQKDGKVLLWNQVKSKINVPVKITDTQENTLLTTLNPKMTTNITIAGLGSSSTN